MQIKFFSIKDNMTASASDIKSQYKELIKKHHPDIIGVKGEADMKQINLEFEYIMQNGLNKAQNEKEKQAWQNFREYAEILEKIIFLDGIKIEVIGSWLWVSGNTYQYHEIIKKAGFKYSGNKKAWYWYGGMDVKRYFKGHYTMQQLRNRHNVIELETEKRQAIGMC